MKREAIDFGAVINGCPKLKGAIEKLPKIELDFTPGKMQPMSILQCLKTFKDEGIMGYEYNRGNGKASSITTKEVMTDFEPLSIRSITVGDFRKNTGEYGCRFVTGEGHSRIIGIIEGVNDGTISLHQLNTECALQVVPPEKFIRTYQKNNSGRSHTQNDKLANPDLVFGSSLQDFLSTVEDKGLVEDIDRGIRSTMMAVTMLALHKESKGHRYHNFAEVYELRREASQLSNKTKDEMTIKLSGNARVRLTEALKYWREYIDNVKELSITSGVKGIFRIFNRKGWFGAVVCDQLFSRGENLFHKSPKMLAQACIRYATSMDGYTNSLTGPRVIRTQVLLDSSRILRGTLVSKR